MIRLFTKTLSLGLCAALCAPGAQAAIYTASTSGNFSSTTTWQGGVVPPNQLGGNDIIINSGVVLNLDQSLALNTVNSLVQMNGNAKITASAGTYLALNTGTFIGGNGAVIDVDSLHMGAVTIAYTGNIAANKLAATAATPTLPANMGITAKEVLYVSPGLVFSSGSMVTLGTGTNTPLIVMSGDFATGVTVSNLLLTGNYNLKYTGNIAAIGAGYELTGSGLKDIEIATGSTPVIVSATLNVKGVLKHTSGTLSLNNAANKLVLSGNGSIDASGTGTITGSAKAVVEVTSSATALGTLRFTTGSATLKELVMNATNATAELKIGSTIGIHSLLNLQKGKVNVQGNTLWMLPAATVQGGSAGSYVVTEANGQLAMTVPSGGTATYAIGTAANYAPAMYTDSDGLTDVDSIGLNITEGVKAQGSTGTAVTTQPLVNATWKTSHPTLPVGHYTLDVMWSAGMEMNGFNKAEYHLAQYKGTGWNKGPMGAATTSGSMYSAKREHLGDFTTYAVFDKNTNVSVNDIVTRGTVAIYPNPATNTLHIAVKQQATATIYNTAGQAVHTADVDAANNSINISALAAGTYYISVTGAQNGTATFVKQ